MGKSSLNLKKAVFFDLLAISSLCVGHFCLDAGSFVRMIFSKLFLNSEQKDALRALIKVSPESIGHEVSRFLTEKDFIDPDLYQAISLRYKYERLMNASRKAISIHEKYCLSLGIPLWRIRFEQVRDYVL